MWCYAFFGSKEHEDPGFGGSMFGSGVMVQADESLHTRSVWLLDRMNHA